MDSRTYARSRYIFVVISKVRRATSAASFELETREELSAAKLWSIIKVETESKRSARVTCCFGLRACDVVPFPTGIGYRLVVSESHRRGCLGLTLGQSALSG
jgi:hypothetical protein